MNNNYFSQNNKLNMVDPHFKVDFDNQFLHRRDFPRFFTNNINVTIDMEYSTGIEDKKTSISGKILDLSKQGISIYMDSLLSVSQRVHFKLNLPHSYGFIQGAGRIMWAMEKDGYFKYGLAFNKINSEDDLNKLQVFIDENLINLEIIDRRKGIRRNKKKGTISKEKRTTDRRTNRQIFMKCIRYNRMKKLMENNQYFYLRELQSGPEHRIIRNGKELINFASNNYLGLSTHPEVCEASIKAIEKYGIGTTGSRILNGTIDLHNKFEKKLAEFKNGEACMTYGSGYHTNLGVISALSDKGNNIIIDNVSHASIVDGCWLSKANLFTFKHNNMKDLERVFKKIPLKEQKIIITDGVFSMDGDVAKLDKIYELSQLYQAAVMVDDAHGIGVLGETGRGTSEHFGLQGKIDITVGTLSKALGSHGGFIVASKKVIHYLKHNSRSFIFSASLPAAICAAAHMSLDIIEREPKWIRQLWSNINYLKEELINLEFDIGKTESAIIPILIKDEVLTYTMAGKLEEMGVFINPVAYPAVRKRESRLRVSVMATHDQNDLEEFIKKLKKIRDELYVKNV